MAQYLPLHLVRSYPVGAGTADLIALVGTGTPAGWKPAPERLAVGEVVYVNAMGDMRRGVIVKMTATKAHVALTTDGAVRTGEISGTYRVQTVIADHNYVMVAPAPEPVKTTAAWIGPVASSAPEPAIASPALDTSSEMAKPIDSVVNSGARETTGSAVVRLLERVWARIREDHADLPEVVIVTGSGLSGDNKWGHFRANGWTAREAEHQEAVNRLDIPGVAGAGRMHELFIAGETLAKGSAQVLQTMLHEGAHTLARVREVKDTSRQGRWHNQEFRKHAIEMGLEHRGDKADKAHGYAFVTVTEQTRERYADLLAELDREIHLVVGLPVWMGGVAGQDDRGGEKIGTRPASETKASSSGLKLVCECPEPNIIRASRKVADKMVVTCGDCDTRFRPAE